MSPRDTTCLVTGATGFVGSHVAERCVQEGFRTRTLVRASSQTSLLEQWGVERIVGDLADRDAVARALDGADLVFHCAAKVGDWGPAKAFQQANVQAMTILLDEACRVMPRRFVHVSSLGVYSNGHHYGTDETTIPTKGTDSYANTKIEAERLVMQAYHQRGLPVTVFRPGFIYGPRDRNLLPALFDTLGRQRFMFLGDGKQAVNSIYVGNLVHAIFLCLDRAQAAGQIYNINDDQGLYKRRFITTIAELAGLHVPRRSVPLWLAEVMARAMEAVYRLCRIDTQPVLNRARVKFVGYNLDFSIEKAKRELGYAPVFDYRDGLKQSIQWFQAHGLLPRASSRVRAGRNGGRQPLTANGSQP